MCFSGITTQLGFASFHIQHYSCCSLFSCYTNALSEWKTHFFRYVPWIIETVDYNDASLQNTMQLDIDMLIKFVIYRHWNNNFLRPKMHSRCSIRIKPCPVFQMKYSFPQKHWVFFEFYSVLYLSVLLSMWFPLICHGFVHVTRLWPAPVLNLFSFEVSHVPLTVITASFLKLQVCSQSPGLGSTCQSSGCFSW